VAPLAPRRALLRAPLLAVLVGIALVAVAGCSGSDDPALPEPSLSASPVEPDGAEEAVEPDLSRFYDQELDWQSCAGYECAELEVPLDYAEADGETITLQVLRVPASGEARRIGSLVVNPGGPGVSGVDYAANAETYFGPELRHAFDIVGFDPRGVARSTPLDCLTDAQLDRFVASDPDPDTPAEVARSDRLLQRLGQGCVDRSGDLTAHMSTVEAARDIDVLRAALGDGELGYFGASYGTFLGATYADLFPERVGRMVLDGALDTSLPSLQFNLVQAEGFETALRAYVGQCVDKGGCFLGGSVDAGTQRIRELLDQIERRPLDAGDRVLAVGNAVLGIWAPLYDKKLWPFLDDALRAAFGGDGRTLLSFSDAYISRGEDGYLNNKLEALYAVNCLDHDDAIPSSEVEPLLPEFDDASPTFGRIFAYSMSGCAQWPIHTGRTPEPIVAAGAAPILVIGTTRDPATPLAWAESLADQLESGVLLRRDGDGHTGYRAGNECVDSTVESYLVSGVVPPATVDC
jgi:pimeloyl-ACP methyl ester carboxylesterase